MTCLTIGGVQDQVRGPVLNYDKMPGFKSAATMKGTS